MDSIAGEKLEVEIEGVFYRRWQRVEKALLDDEIKRVFVARPLEEIQLNLAEQTVVVEGEIIQNINAKRGSF